LLRDSLLALQKSFTGIDNEIPERIAAYKAHEQQVDLCCRCALLRFVSVSLEGIDRLQAKLVLSRRVELLQAVKAKIAKLEGTPRFDFNASYLSVLIPLQARSSKRFSFPPLTFAQWRLSSALTRKGRLR
jgi:hypothetical protein